MSCLTGNHTILACLYVIVEMDEKKIMSNAFYIEGLKHFRSQYFQ